MYKKLILIVILYSLFSLGKSEANEIDYSVCFSDIELSEVEYRAIHDWLSIQHETLGLEKDLLASQCALRIGDNKKVLTFLNFVFDRDPENIDALKIKAKLQLNADDLNGAEKILSSLYKTNDTDLEDVILLSTILNDLGDYGRSLEILDKELMKRKEKLLVNNASVTRSSLDEIALYMKKSEIEFGNGKVTDSVDTLKEGFSRNNGSIELFDTLIYVLKDIKDHESADFYISKNCSEPLIQISKHCR